MRISTFSVTNFRSLTRVQKIEFSEKTILVGKNNEGKSNLLKAINIAMNLLVRYEYPYRRRHPLSRYGRKYESMDYDWDRDFPIEKQQQKQRLKTIFRIEFLLNKSELSEFKKSTQSSLNGVLPIEISIGPQSKAEYKIIKEGKGQKSLTEKMEIILEFIRERISVTYIPAIRTEDETLSVIRSMLSEKLQSLEEIAKYREALHTISELQKPLIKHLGETICISLREFLPSVKDVSIEVEEEGRRVSLRPELNVIVDDGTPTDIRFKGDGIKSLVALSLLKNINKSEKEVLLLIEEPESHLHPEAIHNLAHAINKITENNQVIISTHNPLFVERYQVQNNIIINSGRALPAKRIEEIRKILGVKASDNLINASYSLIVEGESDRRSLNAILPTLSDIIAKALKNHVLVVEPLGGAGNLLNKLQTLKNSLYAYHVFLDDDAAGKAKIKEALKEHFLEDSTYNCASCPGLKESELEDCLNVEIYRDAIERQCSIQLDKPAFRGKTKWTTRMKAVYKSNGKTWSDDTEKKIKTIVADCVEANPKNALDQHKRSSIDSLVLGLETFLQSVSN